MLRFAGVSWVASFVLFCAAAGCGPDAEQLTDGGDDTSFVAGDQCAPGRVDSCFCPGGDRGTRVCDDTRNFGECVCERSTTTGPADDDGDSTTTGPMADDGASDSETTAGDPATDTTTGGTETNDTSGQTVDDTAGTVTSETTDETTGDDTTAETGTDVVEPPVTQKSPARMIIMYAPQPGSVKSAAFIPNSPHVYTVDGARYRWNGDSGLLEDISSTEVLITLTYSPDGTQVATTDGTETVWIRDALTWQKQVTLRMALGDVVEDVVYSPDGQRVLLLYRPGNTKTGANGVTMWDTVTGRLLGQYTGNTDEVTTAAFSPDGACIVTGSADRTVRVWDTATVTELARYTLASAVSAVRFTADGSGVLVTTQDKFTLLDRSTGQPAWTQLLYYMSGGMAVLPDGESFLLANGRNVAVYSVATGLKIRSLGEHTASVTHLVMSSDGTRLLTGASDATSRLWKLSDGTFRTLAFRPVGGALRSVSTLANGTELMTAGVDGPVRFWDIASGAYTQTLTDGRHWATATCTASGEVVLVNDDGASVKAWSRSLGRVTKAYSGATSPMALSPDGLRAASAISVTEARIWNIKTGGEQSRLLGHTGAITRFWFSPDGQRVLTVADDNTARLWLADTGALLATYVNADADGFADATFTTDGLSIITMTRRGHLRVWDIATGQSVREFATVSRATKIELSSDGWLLLVRADNDKTLTLWDMQSGRLREKLVSPEDLIAATFSRDGRSVVNISDSKAFFWKLQSVVPDPAAPAP